MLGLLVSLLVAGAPAADAAPDQTPVAATDTAQSSRHRPPAVLPPSFPVSPLRKLMQAQLDSPPRDDGADGLTAAEADAVMTRYLASIGKPVSTVQAGTRP